MKCLSGKISYYSLEIAIEALIQNRIRNHHSDDRGPVNVYECKDCGNFHFTSKGPKCNELQSDENLKRIKSEQQAHYWEGKFKGGR